MSQLQKIHQEKKMRNMPHNRNLEARIGNEWKLNGEMNFMTSQWKNSIISGMNSQIEMAMNVRQSLEETSLKCKILLRLSLAQELREVPSVSKRTQNQTDAVQISHERHLQNRDSHSKQNMLERDDVIPHKARRSLKLVGGTWNLGEQTTSVDWSSEVGGLYSVQHIKQLVQKSKVWLAREMLAKAKLKVQDCVS